MFGYPVREIADLLKAKKIEPADFKNEMTSKWIFSLNSIAVHGTYVGI